VGGQSTSLLGAVEAGEVGRGGGGQQGPTAAAAVRLSRRPPLSAHRQRPLQDGAGGAQAAHQGRGAVCVPVCLYVCRYINIVLGVVEM